MSKESRPRDDRQTGERGLRGSNSVSLCGRVSADPVTRELPSGDTIVTLRLVMTRQPSPMADKSRQASDWVDCVAWGSRAKRTVGGWRTGDLVEVDGALRRRFFRAAGATTTRVEVEVLAGRLVLRGS